MTFEISSQNFEALLSSDKLLLIDFGAEWCVPCRNLAPVIESLAMTYAGRAHICTCDVEENDDIACKYSIRNVPTLLFIKNGKVLDRLVGFTSKERLAALIDSYLLQKDPEVQ